MRSITWTRLPLPAFRCCFARQIKLCLKSFLIGLILFKCSQTVIILTQSYFHDVLEWPLRQTTICGGNFTGYARKFFRMKSAVYRPKMDSFEIMCKNDYLPPQYLLIGNKHGIGKYINRIGYLTKAPSDDVMYKDGVTVIVDRSTSHNYYHAMQDWYNLFLMSKFFNYDFQNLQVFLIDGSPSTHTDIHWSKLFPNLFSVRDVKSPVIFEDAIFNIAGPGNPMEYWELDRLPYVEEFSWTFLSKFDLVSSKSLNCKNLTITLVLRRDYFFHPSSDILQKRNTQRKFQNEKELVHALKQHYVDHNVRTLVAEDMSLKEQLQLIVNTDILAGMHGCALTNTLFMPKHGAIFEMYPKYWNAKNFFSSLARWRGIKYSYWRNERAEFEFQDHYTFVPPDVLLSSIDDMRKRIGCAY